MPCYLPFPLPHSPTLNRYPTHNRNFHRYRSFGELGIPLQWLYSRKLTCINIYKDLLLCSKHSQAPALYLLFSYQPCESHFLIPTYREGSWGSKRVSILSEDKWLLRGRLGVRTLGGLTQKLLPTHLLFCSVGSELRTLNNQQNKISWN